MFQFVRTVVSDIHLCVEQNKIDYETLKKLDLFKTFKIENLKTNAENTKLIIGNDIDFYISDQALIEKLKDYLFALNNIR